ncbi:MAG: biopolymer transporter ExbD [Candidatus Omnitrophica bacterium]|nr:biopolymer transporter ExbD [Candidatus Omnitrophota bacterium]
MKRKSRSQRLIAEINITPLTDVIMVLLLIVMVATPFIFQSSIKITLPQSKSMQQPPLEVTVTINALGDALLENKPYSMRSSADLDLMKFKLQAMFKGKTDTTLLIRGDRTVQYDYVMRVVDLAAQIGVEHVVLLTEYK